MSRSWIDTTGDLPSLKTGATATGVLGTIVLGWFTGVINLIDSLGSFAIDQITGADNFVGSLVDLLFQGVTQFATAAAIANATWLIDLGILGIFVGFIEGIVVIYAIILVVIRVPPWVIGSL